MRLTSVDLPTFGRPTTARIGTRVPCSVTGSLTTPTFAPASRASSLASSRFFSGLGPSGPGRCIPVTCSASRIVSMIAAVTCAAPSAICSCVRGHGRRSRWTGCPKVIASRLPRCGTDPLWPPGTRVPRNDTGTTGAPVTIARYAAPARGLAISPAPRSPSGKTPTARPSSSACRAVWIARRSTCDRSSGIWPQASRNAPSGPENISCLVSACTGRGEEIASRGPSSQPTWLAAITTPPVRGTRDSPYFSRRQRERTSSWTAGRPR